MKPAMKSPFDITLRVAPGDRSIRKRAAAENMLRIVALISAIAPKKLKADAASTGFPKTWKIVPMMSPVKKSVMSSELSNSFLAFCLRVFFSGLFSQFYSVGLSKKSMYGDMRMQAQRL